MVQGSNHPRWFLVGAIVSTDYPDMSHGDWSHSNIKSCFLIGCKISVVSTRISFYCDWIEEKTDGDAKCKNGLESYQKIIYF